KSAKRPRFEQAHADLIDKLEGTHLEEVDNELARLERARKKAEKRNMMIAQAELRTTRTRRQAKRPDYVYNADDFEDDYDENNGDLSDEEFNGGSSRTTPDEEMADFVLEDDTEGAPRRSTRNAGKRSRTAESAKPTGRRSARLAENAADNRSTTSGDDDLDISAGKVVKRARTATASPLAVDRLSLEHETDSKIKPSEIAVESVAGRKRSKFWFYAVESPNGGAGSASLEPEPVKGKQNGTSVGSSVDKDGEIAQQNGSLGLDLNGNGK
ncbi:hypothetical protein FRC09_014550, partial [Ceratobasidium sp. 395]